MKIPRPAVVDFETQTIGPRPHYPPAPVGVSIERPGRAAKYWSWGHPTGNNCSKDDARRALLEVWDHPDGILCHHARFDLEVAEVHLDLPPPAWDRVHDTLLLAFLEDPYSRDLGLKPLAARHLGMPPEERDAVADWLIEHQPTPGVRITYKNFGAHISLAPASVVGPYANGDARRTSALFHHLYPRIVERGMLAAYDRERRVAPILNAMERRGVRVHLERLRVDVDIYDAAQAKLDAWLRKRIRGGTSLNLDSDAELCVALEAEDLIDVALMGVTEKTGRVRMDKAALAAGVRDPALLAMLRYRTQLGTCLGTFMRPWLAGAEETGGLIYTSWNQTRGESNGGARTGRLSSGGKTASAGNFQNIPNEFETPKLPIRLPPLPLCRSYVAPHARGEVLAGRDYQGQELRVLGHFEDGALLEAYRADPWLDVHEHARVSINRMLGRNFERKPIKNLGFAIIYSAGAPRIAEMLSISYDQAVELKRAYLKVFPGLKKLYDDTRDRAARGEPIRTWGGREYFCETPRIIDGRIRTFAHRLPNYLVQGSSADCTKAALIAFDDARRPEWKLLLQVHDEIVTSVPRRDLKAAHTCLRDAMAAVDFDIPMLSEGEYGDDWGSMKSWDKGGELMRTAA
jgi:DNA polymerase I-like protein with 3'-5' exonuclease and polymerase domains